MNLETTTFRKLIKEDSFKSFTLIQFNNNENTLIVECAGKKHLVKSIPNSGLIEEGNHFVVCNSKSQSFIVADKYFFNNAKREIEKNLKANYANTLEELNKKIRLDMKLQYDKIIKYENNKFKTDVKVLLFKDVEETYSDSDFKIEEDGRIVIFNDHETTVIEKDKFVRVSKFEHIEKASWF